MDVQASRKWRNVLHQRKSWNTDLFKLRWNSIKKIWKQQKQTNKQTRNILVSSPGLLRDLWVEVERMAWPWGAAGLWDLLATLTEGDFSFGFVYGAYQSRGYRPSKIRLAVFTSLALGQKDVLLKRQKKPGIVGKVKYLEPAVPLFGILPSFTNTQSATEKNPQSAGPLRVFKTPLVEQTSK